MVKKAQKKSVLSSALITVFVVIMLITSGPAQAVSVKISGLDDSYTPGSSISFKVKIEIEDPDQYVPITNISLNLTGPSGINKKSTFYLNGTPILGSDSIISISPDDDNPSGQYGYGYGYGFDEELEQGTNFGYGYGYGYGYGGKLKYKYDVTINTTSLPEGSYSMFASLNTGNADKPAFVSEEETFEITTVPEPGPEPKIISWGNDKTGNDSLSITVNKSETVRFNATADQVITEWKWDVDHEEQNNNFDNLSYSFDTNGSHKVKVEAKNDNGTSDDITWDINVENNPPTSPIQVTIEINPDHINPKSNGEITVTIFNNDSAGFDVGDVNIPTVKFGPNGAAPFWNNSPADKKLMLKFHTEDTGIQCGDTQATLTGKTYSEQDIIGTGSFRTKECSIDVQLSTDASGITTTTVTQESPSGDMTITIPAGTRALDKDGNPLLNITINSLTDLSPKAKKKLSPKDRPIGEFVELEPSGATFTPPIQIRYNYKEPLPGGVSESSLQIRTYNETTDTWETLPIVERNTEENYIIANVSHFSTFALIGTVSEGSPSVPGDNSGGSSGGGGVITQEPYDNIAKAETQERNLIAGKPVLYTYTTPELGVYELAVTGNENENNIAIRVEFLKGTSKLVTSPAPGTVYKNVNIWAGTKRMKEAVIRLKVENSWLGSNSFTTGEVKMVKWDGNKWIMLDTTESGKDASYTYFEVKTDTFSGFAITGLKDGVLPTATPIATQQPEETPTGTGTSTATTTQTPTSEASPVNLATIMVVIVLIAIVAVVYVKRKEIFKK